LIDFDKLALPISEAFVVGRQCALEADVAYNKQLNCYLLNIQISFNLRKYEV